LPAVESRNFFKNLIRHGTLETVTKLQPAQFVGEGRFEKHPDCGRFVNRPYGRCGKIVGFGTASELPGYYQSAPPEFGGL